MDDTVMGFIGGGNMAISLIGGLIADGHPAGSILVAEPDDDRRRQVAERFGVRTHAENGAVIDAADAVVLAVKPQMLAQVCRALSEPVLKRRPLMISIAAGVRAGDLTRWLGDDDLPLVRVMPNTPALVQSGASGLYATAAVSSDQRAVAEAAMAAVGITCWVENEALLNAVTAISGSGPAYFFRMMEAMQAAGESLGLDTDTARRLTLHTALGAARMALESGDDPGTLRARVTSPGGTTERALELLESGGFARAVDQAVRGAETRSRELAEELGRS